ncbi:MAG: hypothetical protein ACM3U2_19325 [Deltaproteobacteria bacterium]
MAWCALAFLTSIVPARSLGAPPADAERPKVPDKEGAPPQKSATAKKGEAEKNAAEEKKLDPRAMIRKLQAPTTVNFDKTPLKDVAAQLSKRHGIVIRLDEAALKRAKVAPDAPITATIKNLTLNAALGQLLKGLKLRHLAKDGVIVITSDVEDLDLEKVGKEHVERKAEETRERAELADKAAAAARDAAIAQRVAAMMGQAMAPADLAAMEKQFTRQFNAAARIELHFVDKVCEPTPEQRTEIDDALERYRADLVKKYSENHKRLARGGRQVAGNPFAGDVHEMVRRSIARTVKTNLSAGQVARFEEEIARRTADRKQAAVSHLVARLDGDLNLSAEQRDKLTESLAVNWTVTWDQQFEVMLRQPGAQFLPQLPERLVTPYLTPTQRKIWRAGRENNQPNQGVIFFQGGFAGGLGIAVDVLGNDVDDEDDDEPVPPQAPDAGRKNRSNDAKEEKANDGKAE